MDRTWRLGIIFVLGLAIVAVIGARSKLRAPSEATPPASRQAPVSEAAVPAAQPIPAAAGRSPSAAASPTAARPRDESPPRQKLEWSPESAVPMTSASLPAKRQTAPELPSQPLKPPTASGAAARPQTAPAREETPPPPPAHLPQLIELGSKTCVPCKMMAPILDELRRDFSGRLEVIFYDIYERRDMAEAYRIRVIPTQVFLDVEGKEFFRHQGFYPKDEVLARFREHGITLESK